MSFPRYREYRHSGTEWLGEIPEHWDVKRIGFYFSERREKVSDLIYPALSVTKKGIVPQLETAAKSDDGGNRKRVCKGDFVINSRSDRNGSSGVSDLDGSVSLICTVLQPQERIHNSFVHHLLRSQPFQEEFYRHGKGIVADLWSTNYSEMRNILLAMPPLIEQAGIATFLDREIAKIDDLVREQVHLLELLEEKRQAVIYYAITKGLAPGVETKSSGLDWPARVPAHWEVLPLTRVIRQFVDYRGVTPNKLDEGPVPLITATQIKRGRIDHSLDPIFISEEEYQARMTRGFPQRGDVLLTTEAPLGETAQIDNERVSPGQRIILMKVDPNKIINEYLFSHFLSQFGQKELWIRSSGSTASGIRADRLRASAILVPPLSEQAEIVQYIADKIKHLAPTEDVVRQQLELLQEHRSALISAAVTGKIDVRNLVPLQSEAA